MRVVTIGTCLIAFSVAGCATITKGTTQQVVVNTPGVPGATCTLTSSAIGSMMTVTPGIVTVTKSQDSIAVRCSKEGYNEGTALIASNLEGMTAGNLVLGGVIGLGVDAASGALNKYAPQVDVVMTPLASKRNR